MFTYEKIFSTTRSLWRYSTLKEQQTALKCLNLLGKSMKLWI